MKKESKKRIITVKAIHRSEPSKTVKIKADLNKTLGRTFYDYVTELKANGFIWVQMA